MKDHYDTVSELKKGIATVIAEASTASEEAETPPERAISTPFLVNRRPRPTFSSTDESQDGGMPDLSYQRQVEQAQEQIAVPRSTRAMKRALVSVDDPTRLHTDKRGKLGLSPIAVSGSMTAASNSSTTATDEADLSEVRSPINDRDQDTVSSATNALGGQPAALGHRTSDIRRGGGIVQGDLRNILTGLRNPNRKVRVATIEEVMSRLEAAGSQIPSLTAVKLP